MGFQNTDQGYVDRSKAAQIVMYLFLKRRLFVVFSSVSLVLVVLIALFCYLPKHYECNLELEAAENYLASAVLSGEHKNHVHRMVRRVGMQSKSFGLPLLILKVRYPAISHVIGFSLLLGWL